MSNERRCQTSDNVITSENIIMSESVRLDRREMEELMSMSDSAKEKQRWTSRQDAVTGVEISATYNTNCGLKPPDMDVIAHPVGKSRRKSAPTLLATTNLASVC